MVFSKNSLFFKKSSGRKSTLPQVSLFFSRPCLKRCFFFEQNNIFFVSKTSRTASNMFAFIWSWCSIGFNSVVKCCFCYFQNILKKISSSVRFIRLIRIPTPQSGGGSEVGHLHHRSPSRTLCLINPESELQDHPHKVPHKHSNHKYDQSPAQSPSNFRI